MKFFSKFLIVICLFSFSNSILANKGSFLPGYIILKNGSKLNGKIMQSSFIEREVKINFLRQGDKMSKKYSASKLREYAIQLAEKNDAGTINKHWVHYVSITVNKPPKIFASKRVFVERKLKGDITLYRYYYEYRADVDHPYRYQYYIQLKGGAFQLVDEENFNDFSKKLFAAYPALKNRVGQEKFRYPNFERMIRDYNFWLENKHDKNIYRVALSNN